MPPRSGGAPVLGLSPLGYPVPTDAAGLGPATGPATITHGDEPSQRLGTVRRREVEARRGWRGIPRPGSGRGGKHVLPRPERGERRAVPRGTRHLRRPAAARLIRKSAAARRAWRLSNRPAGAPA